MSIENALLKDNTDISQAEYKRALQLRGQLRAMVDSRDKAIAEHHLDREFCLPDGLWQYINNAANDFVQAYTHVRDATYEELNRLRFRTPVFSGYHLLSLTLAAHADGPVTSVDPIPHDYDNWIKTHRSKPDAWVELWQRYRCLIPPEFLFSPPKKLGEVGWLIDGIVVNHDTYVYQERLNMLLQSGALGSILTLDRPTFLEIGGGYGGLASAILQMVPGSLYIICDLPESLMFSALYLQLIGKDVFVADTPERLAALPENGVVVMPNYLFSFLVKLRSPVDLAINTLSLSEMNRHQIATYGSGIAELLGESGLFYEQNQDVRVIGHQYAKLVLELHFASRLEINPMLAAATEGKPDLWANNQMALDRLVAFSNLETAARLRTERQQRMAG